MQLLHMYIYISGNSTQAFLKNLTRDDVWLQRLFSQLFVKFLLLRLQATFLLLHDRVTSTCIIVAISQLLSL